MSGLGIVDSLGSSLNIGTDAVVVACGEAVEVVASMDGDSIVGSVVANGGSVLGDLAIGNVVCSLGTSKETITSDDSIGGNRRAL